MTKEMMPSKPRRRAERERDLADKQIANQTALRGRVADLVLADESTFWMTESD